MNALVQLSQRLSERETFSLVAVLALVGFVSFCIGWVTARTHKKGREDSLPIEMLPGFFWSADAQGNIGYISPNVCTYIGKTAETIRNDWRACVHPDDAAVRDHTWQVLRESGSPQEHDLRIRRHDGVYRWFHSRTEPLHGRNGEVLRWYTVTTDIEDRKQMEVALERNEQELRLTLERIPGMIVVNDASGELDYVNKQVLDYVGADISELRALGWAERLHPDDKERIVRGWLDCIEYKRPQYESFRLRRFDGEYRWFEVLNQPVLGLDGEVLKWYALLLDVEATRSAQQAVEQSTIQLRRLLETLPAMVWTAAADGEPDYISQRVLDFTGHTLSEIRASGWAKYIHPDDLQATGLIYRNAMKKGILYDSEHRLRRFDGVYRWVHVRAEPVFGETGEILRWYGINLDIDETKRAQEALRERDKHIQLVTDTLPGLVWSSFPNGTPSYLNRRVVEYTGRDLAYFTSSWHTMIHPDDLDVTIAAWERSIQTGEVYEIEHRLLRFDGTYRWFHVRCEPLMDSQGNVVHWYGLNTDITDRKNAAESLYRTHAKLAKTSQLVAIAEASASIAHEINQPLAAIVANGYACSKWLQNEHANIDRARLSAERIIRDGKRAADIVHRIQALFKNATPRMTSFDFEDLIEEVLRLMRAQRATSKVVLRRDLQEDLPLVRADRVQVQQVIINLIQNALDALQDNPPQKPAIMIESRWNGSQLTVGVRDNGAGLNGTENLFEAFVTTKENGMGMGLAISRSIIEAHEGKLWAANNEPNGAAFFFTLPLY
ncbi:PAS domain-containing sensor histidine kinase [Acidicapsa ligni]|uniref:PAS domain-containing sensor histidine kinase n=1 Tax=Acidicapsa ligni TaxID=542300 RepID=UPI0021E0E6E1|nr:PAS domain-containing protein [Acidicapsa ligni]